MPEQRQGAIHFFQANACQYRTVDLRPFSSAFQDQTGRQSFAENGILFFLFS